MGDVGRPITRDPGTTSTSPRLDFVSYRQARNAKIQDAALSLWRFSCFTWHRFLLGVPLILVAILLKVATFSVWEFPPVTVRHASVYWTAWRCAQPYPPLPRNVCRRFASAARPSTWDWPSDGGSEASIRLFSKSEPANVGCSRSATWFSHCICFRFRFINLGP